MLKSLFARLVSAVRANPALFSGGAQVLLGLIVASGFHLTPLQSAIVQGAGGVLSAVVVAFLARPVAPSAYAGIVTAIGSLLIAYGVPHVTGPVVSMAAGLVAALVAFILHGHVSPAKPKPVPVPAPAAPSPAPPAAKAATF